MTQTNNTGRAIGTPGFSGPKTTKKTSKPEKLMAFGKLLVEIVRLQRDLVGLLKDSQGINIDFVKSIWYITLSLLYEIGKWLSHCLLFAV